MARIVVNASRKIGAIHPHLYGQFIEHLARCIYGGIYEPGSPLADDRGFRRDVLEAVRDLKVPILRWPGGNFASGYHWLDGVGTQRRARPELAWKTVEPNTFGTNEFIEYCRAVGCEPYICLNMGNGTIDEAVAWLEYCNVESGTYYSDLRREHGFAQPHGVKYWGLGNEIWGDFQIGHKTAADYAWQARDWAKVLKRLDPSIKLVACGGTGNSPSMRWDMEVLERTADFIDYIALHYYWRPRGENEYYGALAGAYDFERYLRAVEALIDAIRRDKGIRHPIWVSIDEWNISYHSGDHQLFYTLRDALAVAIFIHMMQRHCNTVKMGNMAQMVNVIAPILARPEGMLRQTIYWPLWLAANVSGATLIDCWADVEEWEVDFIADRRFPYLDVVATLDEDGERVVVSVVNAHETDDIEAAIKVSGVELTDDAFARVLTADSVVARNDFDNPEQVKLEGFETVGGNEISITFPAHSLTVVELEIV